MAIPEITCPMQVSTSTHLAQITVPGTTAYEEVLRLQTEMYRHAARDRSKAVVEIEHLSAESVTYIAIYRLDCNLPICTVKVVKPPETFIEELVYFVPDSPPARDFHSGRIAELGGFAIRAGIERGEIPDILDALALALLHLTDPAITSFLLMPRRHLMRLFRAAIPQLMPPYRIGLCLDVLCWNESSALLHALRETNFKGHHFGLHGAPYIYTISRQMIEQDLALRMAVLEERRQHPAFVHLLCEAMHQAQVDIQQELAQLNREIAVGKLS